MRSSSLLCVYGRLQCDCIWEEVRAHKHLHKGTHTQEADTAMCNKTSSNYHQSAKFSLCVRRDWEDEWLRGTERNWQVPANFRELESRNFRCNTREDISFLSDAAGRDELYRDLYNDWLCHWWLEIVSSVYLLLTAALTTVTAVQSDSRDSAAQEDIHTHTVLKCSPGQVHEETLCLSSLGNAQPQHSTHWNANLSPIPTRFKTARKCKTSCHSPAFKQEGER